MSHTILDGEYIDENDWILKTTHPRITYEELTECFIVDMGDGAWCEVYGLNRFKRAVEIADNVNEEYYV